MVEDDSGVVSDLGVFGPVEREHLVELEDGLIILLIAGGEEIIDFGIDLAVELQLMHDASCAIIRIQSLRVALKTSLTESLYVSQVFIGGLFEDEMLADILTHQDVARRAIYISKGVRCSGEQNSPPQAQDET